MQLYDKNNIQSLPQEQRGTRPLIAHMIQDGVDKYITNLDTDLKFLVIDDHLLPITVNDREYTNTYLTSAYYCVYHLEHILAERYPKLSLLHKPLLATMGGCLKMMQVNKSVIINNSLLTTNLHPSLTQNQLERVVGFLVDAYPQHQLIFRNLDLYNCDHLTSMLQKLKFRLFKAREVCIYDPSQKKGFHKRVHYHHRRDRRLLEGSGYEVVRSQNFSSEDITAALSLYRKLYVEKFTAFSPGYTELFLTKAIKTGSLHLMALKKAGKMDAVAGYSVRNDTMIVPFLGYDTHHESTSELYRMITLLIIEEAEKHQVILNDGSGGERAKKARGMVPVLEYVAQYDQHLNFARRGFWAFAEKANHLFSS